MENSSYDAGYQVGHTIGKAFLLIILFVKAYFIYKYFKKNSKNKTYGYHVFFEWKWIVLLAIVLIIVYALNRRKNR